MYTEHETEHERIRLDYDPKVVVGEITRVYQSIWTRTPVCSVHYGHGNSLDVACKETPRMRKQLNAASGDVDLRVVLALPGAELKRARVKGATIDLTVLQGGLCDEALLGLSDYEDDLLYLPEDAPVGCRLCTYLSTDTINGWKHFQKTTGKVITLSAYLAMEASMQPVGGQTIDISRAVKAQADGVPMCESCCTFLVNTSMLTYRCPDCGLEHIGRLTPDGTIHVRPAYKHTTKIRIIQES
jgi:predicted RNA-binding Zn-ribbon protein involved in translation (DUF1610 family)